MVFGRTGSARPLSVKLVSSLPKAASLSGLALAALLALPFATTSCTSDDAEAPKEPVVPAQEVTPYPDDPALAATPEADAAKAAQPEPPAEDMSGALTDAPIGAPKDIPTMKDAPDEEPAAANGPGKTPGAARDDGGDAYQGAFEDNATDYAQTGQAAPAVPGAKAGKAGKGKAKSAHKGGKKGGGKAAKAGKETRYVDAIMLNVRSKPNPKATVVRRLLGGDEVQIEIQGDYAKLKKGEWVRSKFLSAQPTRKVSQEEADAAWHGGKDLEAPGAKAVKTGKKSGKKTAHKGGKGKGKAKAKQAAETPPPPPTADPADPLGPTEPAAAPAP